MFKSLLVLSLAALTAIQASDFDDAESALSDFRKASSDNLNGAFVEHTKLSIEIDSVAFGVKEAGKTALHQQISLSPNSKCRSILVQVADADLDACVNKAADAAIGAVHEQGSGFSKTVLSALYLQESDVVHCAQSDSECLDAAIANIQQLTVELPALLDGEVEKSRQAVEAQIDTIKACASLVEDKVKKLLKHC